LEKSGKVYGSGQLALEYGFTDVDGRQPKWHTDLTPALREFTQTVITSEQLSVPDKKALLEQVAEVSEQVWLPPENRERGIIKALLDGTKDIASTATAVADAWAKLQPLLEDAFKIDT
jgi:hypothetical protein